jgi:hypothetical protein
MVQADTEDKMKAVVKEIEQVGPLYGCDVRGKVRTFKSG